MMTVWGFASASGTNLCYRKLSLDHLQACQELVLVQQLVVEIVLVVLSEEVEIVSDHLEQLAHRYLSFSQ